MAELSCEQCRELAAELALGVLGGRERAEALAHLSRCPRCQDTVSAMTATVGRLVELLPEADPPTGFDQRVIAAITPPGFEEPDVTPPEPHARAARRGVPVAAAVLTGALLAGGGWLFGTLFPVAPGGLPIRTVNVQPTADVMVSPLLAGDQEVGKAYVYAHDPSWIFLSVSDPAGSGSLGANATLTCELTRQDGSTVSLGSFSLQNGQADWAARTPIDTRGLDGAELTSNTGVTLASARFSLPVSAPDTASDTGKHHDDSHTPDGDSDDSHDKDSQHKDSQHKDSQHKDSHDKDSHDKGSHRKDSHDKDTNPKDPHQK